MGISPLPGPIGYASQYHYALVSMQNIWDKGALGRRIAQEGLGHYLGLTHESVSWQLRANPTTPNAPDITVAALNDMTTEPQRESKWPSPEGIGKKSHVHHLHPRP